MIIVYEVKNQKLALGRCVDLDFQDLRVKKCSYAVLWKQWQVENV